VAKKAKTADEAQTADGTAATQSESTDATVSGYFRQYFRQHPRQLWKRSNEKALQQWLLDNPGHVEPPNTVKNTLANIKSLLRRTHPKRGGARAAEEGEPAAPQPVPSRAKPKDLQQLEERIDGCMTLAREIDEEGLDEVLQLLRRARNRVVWKAGGLV
jgi:hypothetical protein